MSVAVAAAPFAAAAFFCAFSPEFSALVRQKIGGVLSRASHYSSVGDEAVPPHLSAEYIEDYLEYSADASQAFPMLLLPIVGTVLAFDDGISAVGAVVLLALVLPALIVTAVRVLLADPISYVGKKYLRQRYTFLQAAAGSLNLLAVAVVVLTR